MQIKEIISRIRSLYHKGAATDDTRLSDRLIYAKLKSSRALMVKREIDKKRQVSDWIVQTIKCMELVETHPNECPCLPAPGCDILRTKNKIPKPIQSTFGPELEAVSNMDGTIIFSKTDWVKKKYKSGNKFTAGNPDYFIKDDYLFLTVNSLLKYITVSGVFEDPLSIVYLDACAESCIDPMEQEFPLDEHLTDAIVGAVAQELISMFKQIPADGENNAIEDASGGPSLRQAPQQQQ